MTTEKKTQSCPYWAPSREQQCLMTRGGLYVPLPEHVFMFCSTSAFTSCHHYIAGCELMMEAALNRGLVQEHGRRRFQRVPGRYTLAIGECDETGRMGDMLDRRAETVDISLGGMRVISSKPLPVSNRVAFTFGRELVGGGVSGKGEVKWCRAGKDGRAFVAGLAFSDPQTGKLVGRCVDAL